MVNWMRFVTPVSAFMLTNPSDEDLATKMANCYSDAVSTAQTILTNDFLLSGNKGTLRQGFLDAIRYGKKLNVPVSPTFDSLIGKAVVMFWSNATFKNIYTGLPPGGIAFSGSNKVISPGICNPMPPFISGIGFVPTNLIFLNHLVLMFSMHLTTISGLHTIYTMSGPIAPIIAPLPWVGVY